jgi:hypothetical protein
MESLVLRLFLPPLTVLAAGWLQHRVGPRLSGRLVGLPLTSGPVVLVLLVAEGAPAAAVAAQGVLAGQVMVVGFTCAYAIASTRSTALSSLAAAGAVTAVLGAGARAATTATVGWSGLAVVPLALIALWLWRPHAASVVAPTRASGAQLGFRAVLTGVLVAGLSTSSRVLGAGLTGVLASVPLVIAVVAPSAHRDAGSPVARSMLRGTLTVVPGTATFAAVLTITLVPLGGPAAFIAAGGSLALVNGAVSKWEERSR